MHLPVAWAALFTQNAPCRLVIFVRGFTTGTNEDVASLRRNCRLAYWSGSKKTLRNRKDAKMATDAAARSKPFEESLTARDSCSEIAGLWVVDGTIACEVMCKLAFVCLQISGQKRRRLDLSPNVVQRMCEWQCEHAITADAPEATATRLLFLAHLQKLQQACKGVIT